MAASAQHIDAVELEIVKSSLDGIVQEMQNSLFRTGYSTIVRESQDASCALMNARGEVIAQHIVLPLHIGSFPACCQAVIRDYDDIVGVPVFGVDDDPHWHPCEMMAERDGGLATAGHYVGVSVGAGATVRAAARGAYKTLDKLSMPASPFRISRSPTAGCIRRPIRSSCIRSTSTRRMSWTMRR